MITSFGVDPSTSAIGVGVVDEQGKLLEALLITPDNAKEPFYMRVSDMMLDLEELLVDWMPRYIAIEIPSIHKENRKGQARYGFGAGAAWLCANIHKALYDRKVEPCTIKVYDAQEWTKGVKKPDRAALVALRYPSYNIDKDPGYDVADAIQLAERCMQDVLFEARLPRSGTIEKPVR